MNIKLRVANLIKKYDTSCPKSLANHLGIKIISLELPDCNRGFLVRCLKRKYILLNTNLSEEGQIVVVCHELGHAVMHHGYGYQYHPNKMYYIPCRREREANEFTTYLLAHSHDIDSTLIPKIINEKRPDPIIIHKMLTEFISY